MKNPDKSLVGQPNITKETEKLEKDRLREALISGADALIEKPFSDESLDKENEKRFLTSYTENNPARKYLRADMKPYVKKFPLEYYELIYKLHGWPTDGKKLYKRPAIVGQWTNEIIYYRFPEGILKEIQQRNPYAVSGARLHKHFQWLTEIGEAELTQFVADAIRIMKKAKYWADFKRQLAIEFGLPYQGELFSE